VRCPRLFAQESAVERAAAISGGDFAAKWIAGTWRVSRYLSGEISQKATIPANLCLFLRWVEFSGVGEDFDEAAGKASELAA
jgi:hypothetical protein